jgi:uncharacterized protein YciI
VFIALSTFHVPFEELAALRPRHLEFLDDLEARGLLVAAGPQDPPTGGCVVLRAADLAEATGIMSAEPFAAAGLATYSITSVRVTRGGEVRPAAGT